MKMTRVSIFLKLTLASTLGVALASLVFLPFSSLAASNGIYPYLLVAVLILVYTSTYFVVGKKLVFSKFHDNDQLFRIKWHSLTAFGTVLLAFLISYLTLAGHVTKLSGNYELSINDLDSGYFASQPKAKQKSLERSQNLFSANSNEYLIIPEDAFNYDLHRRVYQQGTNQLLHSRYIDVRNGDQFDVRQWEDAPINRPTTCLEGDGFSCTLEPVKGGVAFCTVYNTRTGAAQNTVCQMLVNEIFTLSIESAETTKDGMKDIFNALVSHKTEDIVLKSE